MSSHRRQREDLREIAKQLFTNAAASSSTRSPDFRAHTSQSDLVALWDCGDPADAAHLATAICATPWGGRRLRAVFADTCFAPMMPRLCLPDGDAEERYAHLRTLEKSSPHLLLIHQARDSRLARVIALCASRHLLLLGAPPASPTGMSGLIRCLEEGSLDEPIGALDAQTRPDPGPAAFPSSAFTQRCERLGRWRPGETLPLSLEEFLARSVPPARPLSWAWTMIDETSFQEACGATSQG